MIFWSLKCMCLDGFLCLACIKPGVFCHLSSFHILIFSWWTVQTCRTKLNRDDLYDDEFHICWCYYFVFVFCFFCMKHYNMQFQILSYEDPMIYLVQDFGCRKETRKICLKTSTEKSIELGMENHIGKWRCILYLV